MERRNVQQPIFRNFTIANIKMTKDEVFDNFIIEFNFLFFYTSFEHPKYSIIFQVVNIDFPNGRIKVFHFPNCYIVQNCQL